jgi:hypothetical protein
MLDKAAYDGVIGGISISYFFGNEVACCHEICVVGFLSYLRCIPSALIGTTPTLSTNGPAQHTKHEFRTEERS